MISCPLPRMRLPAPCLIALVLAACLGVSERSHAQPTRSADYIVAVVNSEPITNQEVQTLVLRLQREAQAQGRPVDAPEAKKLALEQLINDKAQLQQARDAGIVVDEAEKWNQHWNRLFLSK